MTEPAPSKGVAILFYALLLVVGIGFFLGPVAGLIVWRIRRDEAFVDFHGRQSLDLAITALLFGGGAYLLGLILAEAWPVLGAAVQWLSVAIVVLQGVLAVWGLVHAAQARTVPLPLSVTWLRRRQPEETPGAGDDDA